MATYEVGLQLRNYLFILVDAEDEEEAQDIADSRFDPADYAEQIKHGHWEIVDVELVDDGTEEDSTDADV